MARNDQSVFCHTCGHNTQNSHRSRPAIEDECHHDAVGAIVSLDIGQSERPEQRNLAPKWSLLQHMNLKETRAKKEGERAKAREREQTQ